MYWLKNPFFLVILIILVSKLSNSQSTLFVYHFLHDAALYIDVCYLNGNCFPPHAILLCIFVVIKQLHCNDNSAYKVANLCLRIHVHVMKDSHRFLRICYMCNTFIQGYQVVLGILGGSVLHVDSYLIQSSKKSFTMYSMFFPR